MITIDDLPDDALLEIFDFYVARYHILVFPGYHDYTIKRKIESWQTLVHVCRRWRRLVFVSPRRLNLQLCCTIRRPTRETLDVWPTLPLIIYVNAFEMSMDDVIAELEHSNRICQIGLSCDPTSQIEKLWTAMQVPFPELAVLYLRGLISFEPVPVLPDSFLGGSAPRLRYLALTSIPFPGLPRLLLSATHLVCLWLVNIPHSGYISPEAMATCLSMLTSLESLQLEFEFGQSCPDLKRRRPFSPTRFILPTFKIFWFKGVNEYLEELLAQIDAPQLYQLSITFFHDIDLDTSELNQFMGRTPIIGAYNEVHLIFRISEVTVKLQSHPAPSDHMVEVKIVWNVPYRQFSPISSLAQICTRALSLRLLLTMENLYIHDEYSYLPLDWHNDIENTEWLNLLLPFSATKNLYLSKQFLPRIAPILQELTGGRTTEVLPALQNVLLEGFQPSEPVQEGIANFISSRQLTNHPVAISVWHKELAWEREQLWGRDSITLLPS